VGGGWWCACGCFVELDTNSRHPFALQFGNTVTSNPLTFRVPQGDIIDPYNRISAREKKHYRTEMRGTEVSSRDEKRLGKTLYGGW